MCLGYYGGILVFGVLIFLNYFNEIKGIDNAYSAGPVVYTPITSETYYVVEMNDLLVDGTSIGEENRKVELIFFRSSFLHIQ